MKLIKNNKIINRKFILFLILIVLLSTFCSLLFVKNHSLVAHDESLYASRAKLIIDTNNWWTPFDKAHHKTIGSYWLTALIFKGLGLNEFTARFPSYLFSISSIFVLFKIVKLLSSAQIALISIITVSSSYLWFSYSHYCSPDTLYIFLNLLGVYNLLKVDKEVKKEIKNRYLFLSGFFLSLSFFVRSFMQLLPLVSLSPLIFYKIQKLNKNNTNHIIIGFIVGLIPLVIYFFISFNNYGVSSLVEPYQLLQTKSLTENNIFEGFIFYPRNLIIFTLPFCIFIFNGTRLILRTRSKDLIFLFVVTPLINILILLLTASKYSHYALFAIPFIASNASFGIYECSKSKSSISKLTLRIFALFNTIISTSIFLSLFFRSYLNIQNKFTLIELVIIIGLSLISLSISISLFLNVKLGLSNINSILSILSIQIVLLSFLFAKGIIGNPNNKFKQFVYEREIHEIVVNNKIYLIGKLDDKLQHLLEFYLPSQEKFNLEGFFSKEPLYGFIADKDVSQLRNSNKYKFKVIKKYENINFIKFI